ncbi:nucleoside permease NupC-like [Canis aureus]
MDPVVQGPPSKGTKADKAGCLGTGGSQEGTGKQELSCHWALGKCADQCTHTCHQEQLGQCGLGDCGSALAGSLTPEMEVYWRPVFWRIGLQFLLGLLILRTDPGFMAFDWLGQQVQTFLEYTNAGAEFVFGDTYADHLFAFKVLPIVVFFSTVMSMLYYLGLMQWIIRKVGWVMLVTMGSSPIESVVAAGNIFVGQTGDFCLGSTSLQFGKCLRQNISMEVNLTLCVSLSSRTAALGCLELVLHLFCPILYLLMVEK